MIEVVDQTPWEELERQIREVPLLAQQNGESIFPYANATIELAEVAYADVRPTSLYVLQANLDFQKQLAADLAQQGIDPLALTGSLLLGMPDGTSVGMIPPIAERNGREGTYTIDGAHRTYLGWLSGRKTFKTILISNVPAEYPSTAAPSEWTDIKVYETVPKDSALKRRYRTADPVWMRRNFSHLNGSHPRTA